MRVLALLINTENSSFVVLEPQYKMRHCAHIVLGRCSVVVENMVPAVAASMQMFFCANETFLREPNLLPDCV